MGNTLAFHLYSLKDFEGGYRVAFEALKSLGISVIEPWSGAVPNDPESSTSVSSFRADVEAAGVSFVCGHMTMWDYENRYDEWKQMLLDFGSTDWVIPFAKAGSLAEWLGLLSTFREMAKRLAGDRLGLGYHNHHMELEKLGDKYVMEHLLDNMPELDAQFHIGQFLPGRGIDLPEWIRKYEGRVNSLHINDSTAGGAAPVGQGDCKAEESIKTAIDTGVTTFIVEVPLVQSTFEKVKRDTEYVQELIR